MNSKEQGNLGEIKVAMYFIENGFQVFKPLFTDGPVDLMLLSPDGRALKVEVKSCSKRNKDFYSVELRSIRSNKTKNVIHSFDKDFYDFLAVYLVEDDVVKIFKTSELDVKNSMRIKLEG